MSISELSEYTRIAKYSRYNPEKQRRETWHEQVDRVFNMHEKKFEYCLDELKPYLDEARKAVKQKLVLGSQRALQFGGQAILDKEAKMFNCTFSHANRPRFFGQVMYLLLCGCGVGFSVQTHHIKKLPGILPRSNELVVFTVEDSIEGWADAINVIMASYFDYEYATTAKINLNQYKGKQVVFDLSNIRPKGALIKSSGHKAPGPDGLRNSLLKIEQLLDSCIEAGQTRLKPINVYDIVMHSSDAVLSGGVRRSATICLFSKTDVDMLTAKTGNWFYENPQRGRSNNSVVLLRDETSREEWANIMTNVKQFGEPGFIWTDDLEIGYNPCVEIGLDCIDPKGNTGFAFCNLTEINGKKNKTKEDFIFASKISAIIGTLQAAYTRMDYMFEDELGYNPTEEVLKTEALLGCSITGVQDRPDINLNAEIQQAGAAEVLRWNEIIAKIIGINTAARTTAIKPAGTTSLLLGTASGIHPHHAKRYFRRVQANTMENTLQFFKLFNEDAVETSVWSNNGTDDVITFLCTVPEGARVKNAHSAIKLLEDVKLTQQNWVEYGTRKERCKLKNIRHNVSNTINVKDDEWDEVEQFIYDNRQWYAGISILPMSGDMDYPQAPFQAVYSSKGILKEYGEGSMFASGLIVDGLAAFNDNLWKACDAALGIVNPENTDQEDWIRRAKQFATNYFNNDTRKMTYCLKEVSSWHKWQKLEKTYQDVPWDQLIEEEYSKNAADDAATACAGGNCEIKSF